MNNHQEPSIPRGGIWTLFGAEYVNIEPFKHESDVILRWAFQKQTLLQW